MEIITGVERRRRWRVEEKLRIGAECEQPGASLARVARQHDVSSGLLWNWRRQARRGLLRVDLAPNFFPVQVTDGLSAEQRHAIRQVRVAPLVTSLEDWMRGERARLSRHADVAKAMDYMLKRWAAFTRFLGDGRICLTNNAAERGLRGIALGRKAWLFAGSDRGGERAAAMYSLIVTAKLNDVDPRAWLADVLARIADHPVQRLHELLPWNWRDQKTTALAA